MGKVFILEGDIIKKIVFNDYLLEDEDIEIEVVRVKALIINSSGKILLVRNNNTYQFPGGHKEENESMDDCIIREIKEEIGISLNIKEEPFLCISTYDNDYFGTGQKVLNNIYYYRFFTDEVPNFEETHYDELEMITKFDLYYIYFEYLKDFLLKSIDDGTTDSVIAREMLCVIDEYNKKFGGFV